MGLPPPRPTVQLLLTHPAGELGPRGAGGLHSFLRLGVLMNLLFCLDSIWLMGDLLPWPEVLA